MRIREKEEKRNCQPTEREREEKIKPGEREKGKDKGEKNQLLQSPFGSEQQLGGSQQHLFEGFDSSKSSILHHLGSQEEDSIGQGGEIAQSRHGGEGGEEAGLSRREGIKKRSKSLKCNKVNLDRRPPEKNG